MEITKVERNFTGEKIYGKIDLVTGISGVVALTPAYLFGDPKFAVLLTAVFTLGTLGFYAQKTKEFLLSSQATYFIRERGTHSDNYIPEERKTWINRNPMGISTWRLIPAIFGKSVSFNRKNVKQDEAYRKEMEYFYRSHDIMTEIAKGEWEIAIKGRKVAVLSKKTLTPLDLWDKARANALKI